MSSIAKLAASLALTLATAPAFPALPADRAQALSDLDSPVPEQRAEAVAWVAQHGSMEDSGVLLKRLRDESAFVREFAEQGLWQLWSRSGDPGIDRLMARGVGEMQAGRHAEAIATFTEVIRRRPDFAEAWNKRATVEYLTGNYQASIADCNQVLRRNPRHFGALSGYGQIYFEQAQYEKAIRWWRRALEVNPNLLGVESNLRRAEERLRETRAHTI